MMAENEMFQTKLVNLQKSSLRSNYFPVNKYNKINIDQIDEHYLKPKFRVFCNIF